MGKHEKALPAYQRTCVDGVAYLFYFDAETQIGFGWTGQFADPIEVSHGGFGEPTTNLIFTTVGGDGLPLSPLPWEFTAICRAWLEVITADHTTAREPMRVREVWGG